MDKLLSINPGLAIWTVVSFLFFFFLLRRLAWAPVLQALERREKRISDAIETAEKARAESERTLEEEREALKRAREEGRAIIAGATADAAARSEEILSESKRAAEKLLERARAEIESAETRAVDRVRREAVDVALGAAAKLLGREMDEADHRRLIEEFVAEATESSRGKKP
ncbi:MAG: F0F1 ATP synthase subunit B [Candidatus Eisenbacteria bacterium]